MPPQPIREPIPVRFQGWEIVTELFTVNVVVGDNIPPVPNTTALPDITGDYTLISTIPTATDNCAGIIKCNNNRSVVIFSSELISFIGLIMMETEIQPHKIKL
jgi:hypothetical protein